MAKQPLQFTTPVCRLVGGSVYEPRTEDGDGKPLVVKTGANAGKARVEYSFGVAIPKNPGEQAWYQNPFLAQFYHYAAQQFPQGEYQHPTFAWKIQDGDSTIPNKKGKKNCDRPGFPGNWIIWFSGGQAPRIYNANGTQVLVDPNAVKLGYYVQVFGNCTDNKPSQTPGLYMNHSMVALAAYGEEIVIGPDVSAAGFGQGAQLPPGATLAPPPSAGAFNPAVGNGLPTPPGLPQVPVPLPQMPAAAPMPGMPPAMPVPNLPPMPVGSVPTPVPHAPTAVAAMPLPQVPNPAILAVPAAIPMPPSPVPQVPAVPVARQMTAAANGASYDQLIAQGWNDALLVQHGLMVA